MTSAQDHHPSLLPDQEIDYRSDGPVVVITINRPGQGNSLGRTARDGLFKAWERFEADSTARVAVLTGAGDRIFCSGADLREMASEGAEEPAPDWAPVLGDNVTVTKPTIAAVNGAALGGGFLQMHMCDLVVASRNARIGITEAQWGRGAPWALPLFKAIPRRVVMELLLTAQPMDAQRAYLIGLVNYVVEPDELLPHAMEMALTIAANAPLSLAAAKQMARIADSVTDPLEAARQTRAAYSSVYRSRDAQIGPRAFRDGIAPTWTGS